jgi:hypothetical protein
MGMTTDTDTRMSESKSIRARIWRCLPWMIQAILYLRPSLVTT